jgi:anthranilate/para-aminobenzoate synthase component I
VKTASLCRLETYPSVHHLVSIVRGELAAGRTRADLIRALFPAGSMTGAPKPRAMQAIEDLEPTRRGAYAGSIGYLSFCGSMDLSIVIRTAIVASGSVWLQVGGGVVADSDPELEYRESLHKALSVRRAIAAAANEATAASRATAAAGETTGRGPRTKAGRPFPEDWGGRRRSRRLSGR